MTDHAQNPNASWQPVVSGCKLMPFRSYSQVVADELGVTGDTLGFVRCACQQVVSALTDFYRV
jgi:hypothetical protein